MNFKNNNGKIILGIILAAGYSKRFGSEKLIVKLNGRFLIKHISEKVNSSTVNNFIIITGKNYQIIRGDIPEYTDKIKVNSLGGDAEKYTNTMLMMIDSGKTTDLAIVPTKIVSELSKSGQLLNLTEKISEYKREWKKKLILNRAR
ncbi:Molybdenum cofactor guanylyltransferase [subsurface metagenome]